MPEHQRLAEEAIATTIDTSNGTDPHLLGILSVDELTAIVAEERIGREDAVKIVVAHKATLDATRELVDGLMGRETSGPPERRSHVSRRVGD